MRDWRISEDPWATLARYNAEVARGIVHTDEWRSDMANLQQQFNAEQRANLIDRGFQDCGDGVLRHDEPRSWWRRLLA